MENEVVTAKGVGIGAIFKAFWSASDDPNSKKGKGKDTNTVLTEKQIKELEKASHRVTERAVEVSQGDPIQEETRQRLGMKQHNSNGDNSMKRVQENDSLSKRHTMSSKGKTNTEKQKGEDYEIGNE